MAFAFGWMCLGEVYECPVVCEGDRCSGMGERRGVRCASAWFQAGSKFGRQGTVVGSMLLATGP